MRELFENKLRELFNWYMRELFEHNLCDAGSEVNGISISVSISTIVGTLDLAIDIR